MEVCISFRMLFLGFSSSFYILGHFSVDYQKENPFHLFGSLYS
uniref:Uncharacterized protein n=1 Tax=Arundo donax TaxID=35708 RepID=A0A0A9HFF3_ARUDO